MRGEDAAKPLVSCWYKEFMTFNSLLFKRSTARVSLEEVFHPCVRWEGPPSGFKSCPAPAPASGNLDMLKGFAPLGLRSETMVSNALGHNRSKNQEFGLKLKAFVLTCSRSRLLLLSNKS